MLAPQCDPALAGVYLRSNYAFQFQPPNGTSECDMFYPGTYAFSEPETRALKYFVESLLGQDIKISVTINLESHSEISGIVMPNNYLDIANN